MTSSSTAFLIGSSAITVGWSLPAGQVTSTSSTFGSLARAMRSLMVCRYKSGALLPFGTPPAAVVVTAETTLSSSTVIAAGPTRGQ